MSGHVQQCWMYQLTYRAANGGTDNTFTNGITRGCTDPGANCMLLLLALSLLKLLGAGSIRLISDSSCHTSTIPQYQAS